jgi:GTPase
VKSGFVAVAGRPNVGKSTLVNALCGGKVAIVSDKPQTTRRRIFGIANGDDYQLVLADLPGFPRPLDALTERMQHTVDAAFEDVEAVLFVLSARERIGAGDRFIAKRVYSLGVPVVIALNKVDRLKGGHIAQQMQAAANLGDFHALHPVSATGSSRFSPKGRSTSRRISAPTCRSRPRSPSSSARRRCG